MALAKVCKSSVYSPLGPSVFRNMHVQEDTARQVELVGMYAFDWRIDL